MTRLATAATLMAALVAAPACDAGSAAAPAPLRAFAAASLGDVLADLARVHEAETGQRVLLNLAASSTLARQIAAGAPCDLFLSADEEWADFVLREGRGDPATRRVLLENELVVVVPVDRPIKVFVQSPGPLGASLLDSDTTRVALGDPSHVPAGKYARAALKRMGAWERVASRVIPCDTVRAALALVESGEADAGVVYATDARASSRVRVAEGFPPEVAPPVRYVAVATGNAAPATAAFLAFLQGEEAGRRFARAGFRLPGRNR